MARGFDSAREAALVLGWSVSTYTSHENETRGIRQKAAEKYARSFGVSAAWILMGSSEKHIMPAPTLRNVVSIPIVGSVKTGVWLEADILSFTDAQRADFEQLLLPKDSEPARQAVDPIGVLVEQSDIPELPEGCYACCSRNQIATKGRPLAVLQRVNGKLTETSIIYLDAPIPTDGKIQMYVFAKYEAL